MGRIVVRRATARDAPNLAIVYTHAFEPRTARGVRRWMALVPQDVFVAVVGGAIAAAVTIEYRTLLVDGVRIRTGGIAGVATRWEYRGRGLATRLMKKALRTLKARGISNSTLFTGHNLPAIRIYRRLGFSEESDWIGLWEIPDPPKWLEKRFAWRTKWLPKTPFGKEILSKWRSRVHIVTAHWSATVTFDGKTFAVRPGRRGRPDVVMQGASSLLHCWGDRSVFDRYRRNGTIRLRGDTKDLATWRRLVTLEWRE